MEEIWDGKSSVRTAASPGYTLPAAGCLNGPKGEVSSNPLPEREAGSSDQAPGIKT